ncbi:MAG: ABC transporter permease [Oscillospiraceae bacterium]|nr:ABC transporter permease [Oscillospiraceae bacterium]
MSSKVKSIRRQDIKKFCGENSAFIAFAIVFILAVILAGDTFLSTTNLVNILRNNAVIGIIAIGMTLIIVVGGVDLSVGAQLVLTGWITLEVVNSTQNVILGLAAGLLGGVLTGALAGFFVAKFKIPTFIVTLGAMTIYRSIVLNALRGGGLMVEGEIAAFYISIANSNLWGVPLPIIYWIILTVIFHFFTTKTATGRYIYAVGSNERATMLSSINVDRIRIMVYSISGLLVTLAAVAETSRLGSINSASSGLNHNLDAIAAAVIGGASMSGGKGRIIGTFFGAFTLGIINNMLNLTGVPPFLVGAVRGGVIIGAVLFQKFLDRK